MTKKDYIFFAELFAYIEKNKETLENSDILHLFQMYAKNDNSKFDALTFQKYIQALLHGTKKPVHISL